MCVCAALAFMAAPAAQAQQDRDIPVEVEEPVLVAPNSAEPPDTGAGRVGERQGEEVGVRLGVKPMARINNRVANRVQSRLRNRIGANYDPQANATSPFRVASEQARTAGRPR